MDPDWAWLSDPVPGSPSGVGVKLLRSAFRVTSDQWSRREEQSPRDGHGYHSVLVQLGLKAKRHGFGTYPPWQDSVLLGGRSGSYGATIMMALVCHCLGHGVGVQVLGVILLTYSSRLSREKGGEECAQG